MSQNVASLVDVPRLPQSTMQPWSLVEARAFLTAIRGDRLEALYATAMLTGMRRGEVLALRWEDLDLPNQTLRVSGSLQRVNGALTRAEPKTQQSRRSVVLPSLAADLLQQHRIAQLEERLHAGSMWSDTGYVFATHIGTPIEPRNLLRHFSTLIARTGARRQRFHDLRHCFASLQLAEGTQARVVMEQLGHTQISTTLGIYSHVTQQLHRDAADRLGALFAG